MKFCCVLFLLFFSFKSYAGYNANIVGKVTHVLTYTYTNHILIRLENQPSSHPACQTDYFSIDASTPDATRQQVLSRLLLAYASGEPINIGYDAEGGCSHGRMKVYRVG
ncbi:hypothetical protein [Agaribacterium sp. ZY112]|uniref:hypothetical protein n=1 Tax=Agaribacterium sp. ZY112 TaxID=3233574 RepID=UPI003523642A